MREASTDQESAYFLRQTSARSALLECVAMCGFMPGSGAWEWCRKVGQECCSSFFRG